MFRDELRRSSPRRFRRRSASGSAWRGRADARGPGVPQRILNARGLAVPTGRSSGVATTGRRRSATSGSTRCSSRRVPEPLAFNAEHGRPGHRGIRVAGAEGALPARRPRTSTSGGARASPSPRPGPTWRRCKTRAVRDGDDYVVNGQKIWTTLAQYADWIFCLVRTDPNAPKKQAGISFLLIDMKTPGVTVRPIKLIDGGHEVNEVFFEDVRVPAENLVGEENIGLDLRQVPARQRAHRHRRRRTHQGAPRARRRNAPRRSRRRRHAARRPAVRGPDRGDSRTRSSRSNSPSCGWSPVRPTASRTRRRRC